MASVTLNQVGKVYAGGFNAVKAISFDVPDGSFCVLVGPSGCGKSTLLRMVAGLETTTSGEIRIGGRRANELEPMERDIAFVFQNYALYPQMSVYDNMAYGLRNLKTPKAEIDARVREAAQILDLNDEILSRKPRALSGGQRQRVAMGRAIVRKPAAFLFDEPLSNLDAKLRVHMRVEIRKLQRRLQTTSLYVTHDQLEAMTMADMLVVMNDGRIEQIGAPLEVYNHPKSLFVAGFIGSPSMNFLEGIVVDSGVLQLADGQKLGFDAAKFSTASGQKIVAGVRPEQARLAEEGIDFNRELIEDLGSGRLIHGKVGGSDFTVLEGAVTAPLCQGKLQVAAEALHLFDAASGQRLSA